MPIKLPAALPALMANGLEGEAHPWLTTLRRDAMTRHLKSGLPTPRREDWKYTNLRDLTKDPVAPALSANQASPAIRIRMC